MNTKLLIVLLVIATGAVVLYALNKDTFLTEEHHDDDRVESYEIYPGDVVQKISDREDIVLLDVRTPEEYEEVHLENAVLLPVQQLSQQSLTNIGLGESMKDKEIIIYCRSGARSKTAFDIMNSLGYTNIKSVAGGMIHWEEDEYPYTEVGPYTGPLPNAVAPADEASGGPKIVLDRTSHDFGVIPQYGGTVKTGFVVQNEGTETLEIGQLTTSCSCTSAEITKHSIPPGGKSTLTVVFDPDFHEEPLGVFRRTVFIPTNDPSNSEAEVSITVDIEEGK